MKRFIYAIFALALSFSLQSCLHNDEELFDEPAAQRLANTVSADKELLESATSGWAIRYFTGESYTGYGTTFLAKFNKDGKADVSGEIAPHDMVTTSSFDVISDQGPVITFNTYNEIMHYLAQPYQDDVDGEQGDYEFVIQKATQDTIYVRGKKWGNHMIFVRLPEGTNWVDYLDKTQALEESFMKSYHLISNGADAGLVKFDINNRRVSIADASGKEISEQPYCMGTDGVYLSQPVEIDGTTYQNLKYDDAQLTLTPVDAADAKSYWQGMVTPDLFTSLVEGKAIAGDDNARTVSVNAAHLDKITLTTSSSWINIDKQSDKVVFSIAENNSGHMRSGVVYVETEAGLDSIKVKQCDYDKDIAGDYYLSYYSDYYEQAVTLKASLSKLDADGNATFSFTHVKYPLTITMSYDANTGLLKARCGQKIGVWNGRSTYDMYLLFASDDGYWTSTSTSSLMNFSFDYNETDGTYGVLESDPSNPMVWNYFYICAVTYQGEFSDSSNLLGWLEQMHNVVIYKK